MPMSSEQLQAFESANTGALSNSAVNWLTVIEVTLGAILFLWCVWVLISCYKAWGAGGLTGDNAGGVGLRAIVVTLILFIIITV
jgi:integrating conjugative element protein (TIGR03758 family)